MLTSTGKLARNLNLIFKGAPITKKITLYGHPVIPHRRLTVAQQVHKILVEEIHAGRWQIGTRLPGVVNICSETGLGNQTVQRAFTLLKEDGYVKSDPNKGTYLVSVLPENVQPSAKHVGILMTEEQSRIPYTLWLSHLFMDAALRHGLLGEVRIVASDSDWTEVTTAGKVFTPQVKSVISLIPFTQDPDYEWSPTALPVLFFCHMTDTCRPLVAIDVVYAYYELTRRTVSAGHTEIAFIADLDMNPLYIQLHRDGYRQAMQECQLKIREYTCSHSDKTQVSSLLKKLAKDGSITALITGNLALTEVMLPAAIQLNIDVPGKISMVTLGSSKFPQAGNVCSTGLEIDPEYTARVCFDLLNEFIVTGRCCQTRILMKAKFHPGDTLLNRAASVKKTSKSKTASA